MPRSNTQEERQLMKLIEKMPLPDEDKSSWCEQIRGGNMSAELAEEIRLKLSAPTEGETNPGIRTRYLVDLANLVKRWRLTSQSHNFGRK